MKINGTPIQTPQKQQAGESVNNDAKASVQDSKRSQDGEAAVLSVSHRNSVSVGGVPSEMDKGSVSNLFKSLIANSDNTAQLHSRLSPERVLQLIS